PPSSGVVEVSTEVSSASVEAPAAPDLACVSVIDQSCPYRVRRLVTAQSSSRTVCCLGSLLLFGLVRVAGNRDQRHAVRQGHQLAHHCVPVPGPPYGLHRSTENAAVGGDGEQLIVRTYYHSTDESAAPFGDLSGEHALSAPPLRRVLVDRSPLGI